MAKSQDLIRFPHSVALFKFCFKILELRRPSHKIHDQDLGQIMDFNPSDTSHWKRGKKCVKHIPVLENISSILDVDLEIIQDIADGLIDIDEAWSDFCDAEEERKLSLEEPSIRVERRDKSIELEKLAKEILSENKIQKTPIYIPELIAAFPYVQLIPGDVSDRLARSSRIKPGYYAIRYRKGDIRAHTRIAIAREIARILLHSEREKFQLSNRCDVLSYAEIIEFANALLVPRDALAVEIGKISTRANLIKVLAELFWVPKSVIRARLSSILLEKAATQVFEAQKLDFSEKFSMSTKSSYEENQLKETL